MKLRAFLLVAGMLIFNFGLLFCQTATAPSGSGTELDPYQISTLNNLYWITQNSGEWDKHYIQTADIDAAATIGWDGGKGWTPIGEFLNSFTGVYDGDGYKIQNLYINRPSDDYQGIFGVIYGTNAEVKNLGAVNVNITSDDYAGGIAGRVEGVEVSSCYSTGTVTASDDKAGGIAGEVFDSDIINCYSTGTVTAADNAGGITGYTVFDSEVSGCYSTATVIAFDKNAGGIAGNSDNSDISSCYSTGTVTAGYNAGGIAGKIWAYSEISSCYSTGTVTADVENAGGIVGFEDDYSELNNCYSTATVTAGYYAGGIAGYVYDNSEISSCYSSGTVTANDIYAGGIAGYVYDNSEINSCYSSGTVTAYSEAGGIAGFTWETTINNCYSTGTVTANYSYAGGIAADVAHSTISSCYSTATVTADNYAGGIAANVSHSTITNCYVNSDFYEASLINNGAVGKTTAEMTLYENNGTDPSATYDTWDFYDAATNPTGVWAVDGVNGGYPYLKALADEFGTNNLTLNSNGNGTVYGAGKYNIGASAAIYAEPNNGYEFAKWHNIIGKKGDLSTEQAYLHPLTGDETVSAEFGGLPTIDDPEDTNIPGLAPLGEDGGSPVTIIYEDETITYFFNGYDPEGNPLIYEWQRNGQTVSSENTYTFVPEPLKDGGKSREYTMNFIADDGTGKGQLSAEWKIMVLNADNPIEVTSLTPAPNTSTDPTVSTAGGSYNMTEGETLSFSVDADDPDGSLLWRNWYVNDELVWLNADFDFNTHFMSSSGSPYDIKLYLQGQQGDYQEFHWTVNVSNKEAVTYANSPMILNGSAMIEGLNAESGDAIAAYSGNELRGEILLNSSNFDNFEVNLSENNEEISFVIYDSDNNIIKTVHRTISGEINTAQEITLHGYEEVSNSFVLAENWNYVSFNTIPEDNSVSSVFSNTNISEIRTSTQIYNPSNPEFLNTLKEIKPGVGYLVKMNSNSSIFVNGYSAENSEIQLYEGWNLIGYTERSSADIETAFGSIMDKIIEIKSEVGVYSADMPAYMNTLSYIEENKAYWVKCSEDCVLDFPRVESKENYNNLNKINHLGTVSSDYAVGGESTLNTYSTSPTRPPVSASFGSIEVKTNSFVIYAEIQNPSDNTLCAYNNNELRGISQIIENNKYYTSIVVNSDIAGEEIALKIGDNTIKTISSIPGTTIGKDNLLQLDGSLENEIPASFKVSLFPNPFNPEINISFELPKAERINISVFDINGKLVKTLEDNVFNSGKHSITWNGTDSNNDKMASGIYFVKVKSDSYNTTEKIVMLK